MSSQALIDRSEVKIGTRCLLPTWSAEWRVGVCVSQRDVREGGRVGARVVPGAWEQLQRAVRVAGAVPVRRLCGGGACGHRHAHHGAGRRRRVSPHSQGARPHARGGKTPARSPARSLELYREVSREVSRDCRSYITLPPLAARRCCGGSRRATLSSTSTASGAGWAGRARCGTRRRPGARSSGTPAGSCQRARFTAWSPRCCRRRSAGCRRRRELTTLRPTWRSTSRASRYR